jgi:hypothetical protein
MSAVNQPSGTIGTKTKIVVLTVTCLVALVVYLVYKNENKPSDSSKTFTNSAIPQKIQEALNKLTTSLKVYLYGTISGKLYMKDTDGKYWDCGMVIDCPGMATKAAPILDIFKNYNCADIPDKYKAECAGTLGDKTKIVSIRIQTAKDYEDFIQKSVVGKYAPDISECVGGDNGDGGGTGENVAQVIAQFIGNTFMSLPEYIYAHRDAILNLAKQLGPIVAATKYIGHYAIIFFLLPSILSGNPAQQLQAGIMGGQVAMTELLKWGVGRSAELLASRTAAEEANIISESGGELFTASMSSIMRTAGTLGLEALNFSAIALSKLMGWAGVIQMLGMGLDALDPCGLSGGAMTQGVLDSMKASSDLSLSISSGGMTFPAIWDATLMCDYNLNSNFIWQNCLTEKQKEGKNQKDFCAEDNKKNNDYFQEYLDALKVNSNGQTISQKGGGYSNKMLQKIFEDNVPGFDWSALGDIKPNDIKLPTDKNIKQLDLLFTDQNVILASYVYQYWWLFLGFFIFIIILVFMF